MPSTSNDDLSKYTSFLPGHITLYKSVLFQWNGIRLVGQTRRYKHLVMAPRRCAVRTLLIYSHSLVTSTASVRGEPPPQISPLSILLMVHTSKQWPHGLVQRKTEYGRCLVQWPVHRTGYRDRFYTWFSSVPSYNCRVKPRIGYEYFLANAIQFAIHKSWFNSNRVSLLPCASGWQLSRDVPVAACFLHDIYAVLGEKIKGTLSIYTWYELLKRRKTRTN